jgi:hypothetical protein
MSKSSRGLSNQSEPSDNVSDAPLAPPPSAPGMASTNNYNPVEALEKRFARLKKEMMQLSLALNDIGNLPLSEEDRKKDIYLRKSDFNSADKKSIFLNSEPHVLMWSTGANPQHPWKSEPLKNLLQAQKKFNAIFTPYKKMIDRILDDMGEFYKDFQGRPRTERINTIQDLQQKLAEFQQQEHGFFGDKALLLEKLKHAQQELFTAMSTARQDALSRPAKASSNTEEDQAPFSPWEAALAKAYILDCQKKMKSGEIAEINLESKGQGVRTRFVDFLIDVTTHSSSYPQKTINSVRDLLHISDLSTLPPSKIRVALDDLLIKSGYGRKYELIPMSLFNLMEKTLAGMSKNHGAFSTTDTEREELFAAAEKPLSEGSSRVAEKGSLTSGLFGERKQKNQLEEKIAPTVKTIKTPGSS